MAIVTREEARAELARRGLDLNGQPLNPIGPPARTPLPGAGNATGLPRPRAGSAGELQSLVSSGQLNQQQANQRGITTPLRPAAAPNVRPNTQTSFGTARPSSVFGSAQQDIQAQQAITGTRRQAALQGVLFDRPAPSGQFRAGFAHNKANQVEAYKIDLKSHFGEDINVRFNKKTNAVEYQDPDTRRWALAREPGNIANLAAGFAAEAGVLGAELFVGAATAVVTKNPALALRAEAGAAFAGEAARLLIGQQMGINQDLSIDDIVRKAAVVGGISFAGGVMAAKAVDAVKFIAQSVKGNRFVSRRMTEGLELTTSEALEAQRVISERVKGFRFLTAQQSGDDALLQAQRALSEMPRFSREMGNFTDKQQGHLVQFYNSLNEGFGKTGDPAGLGRDIQSIVNAPNAQRERLLDRATQQAAAQLENAKLTTGLEFEALGPNLRLVGDTEQKAFKEKFDKLAVELNGVLGNEAFIDNVDTARIVNALDTDVKSALFPNLFAADQRLVGSRTEAGEAVDPIVDNSLKILRDSMGQPAQQEAMRKVFDPNAKFTFAEAWQSLSRLKEMSRIAGRGLSTDNPSTGNLKRLVIALDDDIKRAMEKQDGASMLWEDFRNGYREEKIRLDKGAVGQMMFKKDGQLVIADEKVFDRVVFKTGGAREARQFMALTRDAPEARKAIRDAIVSKYNREVIEDGGKINASKHRTFMKRFGGPDGPLEIYFGQHDAKKFAAIGNGIKILADRQAAQKKGLAEINQTFEAGLNKIEPELLASHLFRNADPTKSRKVVSELHKPGLEDQLANYRGEMSILLGERIRDTGQESVTKFGINRIDGTKLRNLLQENDGRTAKMLGDTFGAQYVKDLRVLSSAMDIVSRKAKGQVEDPGITKLLFGIVRIHTGIFTTKGRVLTGVGRVRAVAATRALHNVIMDPEAMRLLIRSRDAPIKSKQAAQVLSVLGATHLLTGDGSSAGKGADVLTSLGEGGVSNMGEPFGIDTSVSPAKNNLVIGQPSLPSPPPRLPPTHVRPQAVLNNPPDPRTFPNPQGNALQGAFGGLLDQLLDDQGKVRR